MQISFHPQSFINLSFQSSLVPRSCISIHLSYIIFFSVSCHSVHQSFHFSVLLVFPSMSLHPNIFSYCFISIYLTLFLPISFLSAHSFTLQSMSFNRSLYVCLSFYLPVFVSIRLSICPPFHLIVFLYVRFSICPFFHLPVFPSVRLSVTPSFYHQS